MRAQPWAEYGVELDAPLAQMDKATVRLVNATSSYNVNSTVLPKIPTGNMHLTKLITWTISIFSLVVGFNISMDFNPTNDLGVGCTASNNK